MWKLTLFFLFLFFAGWLRGCFGGSQRIPTATLDQLTSKEHPSAGVACFSVIMWGASLELGHVHVGCIPMKSRLVRFSRDPNGAPEAMQLPHIRQLHSAADDHRGHGS